MQYLFRIIGGNTQLIVFNTCFSESQARAVTSTVDCAVGMSSDVSDSAAIVFAASFYRALGFGLSVYDAFEQGKTALMLEDMAEQEAPKLMTRVGTDPRLVMLAKRSRKRESSIGRQ